MPSPTGTPVSIDGLSGDKPDGTDSTIALETDHGEGSQIANQENVQRKKRRRNTRDPRSAKMNQAHGSGAGQDDVDTYGVGQVLEFEVQSGCNILDPQSTEGNPEYASGAGHDCMDIHDVDRVQSGKSRGKSWCSCHTIVRVDHY